VEVVKYHRDWITDLYYREMVTKKQEKNHGRHKKSKQEIKKSKEGNPRFSRQMSSSN
jgi:hypothetical protein